MKITANIKYRLISFIPYLLLFLFIFSFNYILPTDPDLGWHLRYGEETIANHVISNTDSFSYTFKGQPILDHEWLSEVIYYILYSKGSFFMLAFISAVFTSFAFFIPLLSKGDIISKTIIVFWSMWSVAYLAHVGARPQNISWVLFSIIISLLFKYRETKNYKLMIPLPFIFLFWANTHLGYFLGLFLIIVFGLLEIIFSFQKKERVNSLKNGIKTAIPIFLAFFVSYYLTAFRPKAAVQISNISNFGDLIKELFIPLGFISDPTGESIRLSIAEWLPPFFENITGTFFLLAIIFSVSIYLIKKFKVNDYKDLFLLLGLIYFSTLSRRNVPFFFLLFIPIFLRNINFSKIINNQYLKLFRYFCYFIMIIVILKQIPANHVNIIRNNSVQTYCRTLGYPCQAIEFIKENKLTGNMFNAYNWGGFLIWQLKDNPVFIDGRVPATTIYSDYKDIMLINSHYYDVLNKYEIDWMILGTNPFFLESIMADGKWKEVYSDDIATILVKK